MSNNSILFSTSEKEKFNSIIITLCQMFPGRLYINTTESKLTIAVTHGTDTEAGTINKIKKALNIQNGDSLRPAYLKESYEVHSARFYNNKCEAVRLLDDNANFKSGLSSFSKLIATDTYDRSQKENALLLMRCISATTESGSRAVFETEQLRVALTLTNS